MPYGYDPSAKIDPMDWLDAAAFPGDCFWGLTDNEGRELLDLTRDIWTQLFGPHGRGWPQLGRNPNGENRTVVDALAALPPLKNLG